MGRKLSLLVLLAAAILSFTGSVYAQTPTEQATESFPAWAWVLIILAFLAFACILFWWWLRARQEAKPEAPVHAPAVPQKPTALETKAQAVEVEMPSAAVQVPPAAAAARSLGAEEAARVSLPVTPDDLKLIEGIGPKIAGVLQSAGIQTFAQLAAANVDHIKQILGAADPRLLRLADPSTWAEQAKHAAAGDFEELRKLQEALRGGRRA